MRSSAAAVPAALLAGCANALQEEVGEPWEPDFTVHGNHATRRAFYGDITFRSGE